MQQLRGMQNAECVSHLSAEVEEAVLLTTCASFLGNIANTSTCRLECAREIA